MARYVLRRLLWMVVLLLAVTALTFVVFYLLPSGDPARLRAGRVATPQVLHDIRENLGLDRPVYVQYWRFVKGVVCCFDLGHSYQSDADVSSLIWNRLPATLSLVLGAALLWFVVGVTVGVLSAVRRGTWLDRVLMFGALLAISAPVYWLGLLALYLFSSDIGSLSGIHVLGTTVDLSIFDGAGSYTGITNDFGRWLGSLLLPWLVLAAGFAAFYARLVRGNLSYELGEDHVRTARAKGLRERTVVLRHALPGALLPVVTVLGLDLGVLLGGAILVEQVFDIHGLGQLSINAIQHSDLPVIQGTVLFGAFFIIVANLLVDVAYAFLDPRVRLE